MGLRSIYSEIDTLLKGIADIKHVHTWNQQLRDILGKENTEVGVPFPACFIELKIKDRIEQLGNGNQLFPLSLRLHIVHQLMDAGNGEFEQNWDVFDLFDKIYLQFQQKMFTGCNSEVLVNIEQDYDHGNLYHLIAEWELNYVYNPANEPVGGIPSGAPIVLIVNEATVTKITV